MRSSNCLAGIDDKTGKDFSFRREWIRRRMKSLDSALAIDVVDYAIMSNHMHLILRNRADVVTSLSHQEVAISWLRVFPGRRLEVDIAEPTQSDVPAANCDCSARFGSRGAANEICPG